MPLYEDKHNAENILKVSEKALAGAFMGLEEALKELTTLASGTAAIALDGWYGVEFEALIPMLKDAGMKATFVSTQSLFLPLDALKAYKAPYVTEDPGFGKVNTTGVIEDIPVPSPPTICSAT